MRSAGILFGLIVAVLCAGLMPTQVAFAGRRSAEAAYDDAISEKNDATARKTSAEAEETAARDAIAALEADMVDINVNLLLAGYLDAGVRMEMIETWQEQLDSSIASANLGDVAMVSGSLDQVDGNSALGDYATAFGNGNYGAAETAAVAADGFFAAAGTHFYTTIPSAWYKYMHSKNEATLTSGQIADALAP